jgi:hypothetical protein
MRFAEDSGSASMLAQMATNLAQYTAAEGDWDATRRAAAEAAKVAAQVGMDDQVTWAVQALAIASAGTGDYGAAARLLGFCDSRSGTLHSQRQAHGAEDILYRRLLAELHQRMTPGTLQAAMLEGAALSAAEALASAMLLEAVV